MALNPYTWGADSVRGVADNIRLHLSGDPADHEQAEQNTRAAEARWNSEDD